MTALTARGHLLDPASVPAEIIAAATAAPLGAARRIASEYRMSVQDALALVMLGATTPIDDE